jgi:hypothetical protein
VKPLSRRLAALFCLALLGALVMLGLVVGSLAGLVGVVVYVVVAALFVGLAVARGRRLWQADPAGPLPPGRTCTCCTTSQSDPVKVV